MKKLSTKRDQKPIGTNPGFRVLEVPSRWRGTSVQVCGLYPFSAGSGTPVIGVPLGRNLLTGSTLCCDPISWFNRAGLILNPSVFVLGLPALGKSTLVRRMALGLAGYGVLPMVFADLKPDYVDLISAIGGQVISLGPGRDSLNPLDTTDSNRAAKRLLNAGFSREANEVLADAKARKTTLVALLVKILRGKAPNDREESIIGKAVEMLDRSRPLDAEAPLFVDLLNLIRSAPDELRDVALDRGNIERYRQLTEDLEASLVSLISGGKLGQTFANPTSNPAKYDRPIVYDISAIDDTQADLQAAVMVSCWSNGFAAVNAASALAETGLEPRRHFFIILDELWRALRAGSGMVDRIDGLTRLNRQVGVGQALITHTMSDFEALPTSEDRAKARGFVERSGMVITAGLPPAEMPLLNKVVKMSQAESELLHSWQSPPAWSETGTNQAPPGRGKFLVKVGGRPGIPIKIDLTHHELHLNDTNKAWH